MDLRGELTIEVAMSGLACAGVPDTVLAHFRRILAAPDPEQAVEDFQTAAAFYFDTVDEGEDGDVKARADRLLALAEEQPNTGPQ